MHSSRMERSSYARKNDMPTFLLIYEWQKWVTTVKGGKASFICSKQGVSWSTVGRDIHWRFEVGCWVRIACVWVSHHWTLVVSLSSLTRTFWRFKEALLSYLWLSFLHLCGDPLFSTFCLNFGSATATESHMRQHDPSSSVTSSYIQNYDAPSFWSLHGS